MWSEGMHLAHIWENSNPGDSRCPFRPLVGGNDESRWQREWPHCRLGGGGREGKERNGREREGGRGRWFESECPT